jgi:hypothetical protein
MDALESRVETQLCKMGLSGVFMVRDLWQHMNWGEAEHSGAVKVASYGVRLLKLSRME